MGKDTPDTPNQDETPNYYVIVPFQTMAAAEWASGHIGCQFDCHVISAHSIDPDALILSSVVIETDV